MVNSKKAAGKPLACSGFCERCSSSSASAYKYIHQLCQPQLTLRKDVHIRVVAKLNAATPSDKIGVTPLVIFVIQVTILEVKGSFSG